VQVAQEELQIIPIKFADAADLANILNQLFASGRIGTVAPGTPSVPGPQPGVVPPVAPGVPGVPGQPGATQERRPLIIAERRSNSLIIHAKKHEVETIKRLITQLDVNIYGGRRVFIYYAENAKSKELAATLNSIYGGRDSVPTTTGTGTGPGRAGQPAPPPPPPGTSSGQFLTPAAVGTIGDLGAIEGQVRFIGDEVTNSVIVTTF